MSVRRLVLAAVSLSAFATALAPIPVAAQGTPDYRCRSGYTMRGSVGSNAVYCFKAGSETLRSNRPVCGVRRYAQDSEGRTDTCTTTRGRKTGYPKCVGGTKSVRAGADRCVNKKPDSRTAAVSCPAGYTMRGSTSGRGSVNCHKPPTETLRNNNPVCGVRRYAPDREGQVDICTTTRDRKTGYPKCIGGTKLVRAGLDRCVDRKPGRTVRPR